MDETKFIMRFSGISIVVYILLMLAIGFLGCTEDVITPNNIIANGNNTSVTGNWIIYDDWTYKSDTLCATLTGTRNAFTGTLYLAPAYAGELNIEGGWYDWGGVWGVKFQTESTKPGVGCLLDYGKWTDGKITGRLTIHMNYDYNIYSRFVTMEKL